MRNRQPAYKAPGHRYADKVNLDFGFDTPLHLSSDFESLLDLWSSVQAQRYFGVSENFSQTGTRMDCLIVDEVSGEWKNGLDDESLHSLLTSTVQSSTRPPKQFRLQVFFNPLIRAPNASFTYQTGLSLAGAKTIFNALHIDAYSLTSLLGQWEFWAPRDATRRASDASLLSHDLSLQYPRWDLEASGTTVSVHMHFEAESNLTSYIITYKEDDTVVTNLRRLLENKLEDIKATKDYSVLLDDPMELHVVILMLSLDAFEFDITRFQNSLWKGFDNVDHIFNGSTVNRQRLAELTKSLQVVSYNAQSHTTHANVASSIAEAISRLHHVFHAFSHSENVGTTNRAQINAETLEYVPRLMEKWKIWLGEWKMRQDTVMDLVSNLMTQQDAANNASIAEDMRKDSSSMHAIIVLTMDFLPGTFIATVLGAGLFSDPQGETHVPRLWLVWLAITLLLTLGTQLIWYYHLRARKQPKIVSSWLPRV